MSDATATDTRLLPEPFADLEPVAATWALPTANERCARRLAGTMPELEAFYEAASARADDAIEDLEQFGLDDMGDDALRLFWMLCSVSVVSFAVDVFKQPKTIDAGDGVLPVTIEPGP